VSWRVAEEVRAARSELEASHAREREAWVAEAAKQREQSAIERGELSAALAAANASLARLQQDAAGV
jgi:hypothetical protein